MAIGGSLYIPRLRRTDKERSHQATRAIADVTMRAEVGGGAVAKMKSEGRNPQARQDSCVIAVNPLMIRFDSNSIRLRTPAASHALSRDRFTPASSSITRARVNEELTLHSMHVTWINGCDKGNEGTTSPEVPLIEIPRDARW